jgi:hypothetical protein
LTVEPLESPYHDDSSKGLKSNFGAGRGAGAGSLDTRNDPGVALPSHFCSECSNAGFRNNEYAAAVGVNELMSTVVPGEANRADSLAAFACAICTAGVLVAAANDVGALLAFAAALATAANALPAPLPTPLTLIVTVSRRTDGTA